jgi:acetyl/propionyl-CoA carboxylase alpha subunit
MFKKVLVANRGEIACRIIRACKELGIQTVAIYNEIESTARHVKMADEAYMIGVNPLDTYLNAERIVDLALEVGAEAIHPGYGFFGGKRTLCKALRGKGYYLYRSSLESYRANGRQGKV